jgi:hypothetical protein
MARPHETKRLVVGTVLTIAAWACGSGFYLAVIRFPDNPTVLQYLFYWLLVFLGGYVLLFAFWFFPVYIVIALMKLRDQKRFELEELGDANEVKDDPEGERKLHEYLTAITSTEARIGLLQRSEPWPGPELPQQKKSSGPTRRFTATTLVAMRACAILGFVAGICLAAVTNPSLAHEEVSRAMHRAFLMRIGVSGVVGALLAAPLGWVVALLFGKTETVRQAEDAEVADDARGSGPEAA